MINSSISPLDTDALAAFNQKCYDDAIHLFQQELEETPNTINHYWYLGLSYFLQGNLQSAQETWITPALMGLLDQQAGWQQNFIQIFDDIITDLVNEENLEKAKLLQNVVQEFNENYVHQLLPKAIQTTTEKLLRMGISSAAESEIEKAASYFIRILEIDENYGDAWYHLALLNLKNKTIEKAFNAIEKALEINPDNHCYHYGYGLIFEANKDYENAVIAHQKSLSLNTDYPQSYLALGRLLIQQHRANEAEEIYRQLCQNVPDCYEGFWELGNLLFNHFQLLSIDERSPEQLQEIISLYEQALALEPNHPQLSLSLANAYDLKGDSEKKDWYFADYQFYCGNFEKAARLYRNYIKKYFDSWEAYSKLLFCLYEIKDYDCTIEVCHEAIHKFPDQFKFYEYLILVYQNYQNIGNLDQANEILELAYQYFPENLELKKLRQWLLPVIYNSTEEVEFYRHRFIQYVEDLTQQLNQYFVNESRHEILEHLAQTLKNRTNFYLQYQGKNDKDLQQQYSLIIHRILALQFPQFIQKCLICPGLPERKIRIGYVSFVMHRHTTASLFRGWLKYSDHQQFTLHSYHVGVDVDNVTEQFQCFSDHFCYLGNRSMEEIADKIIADQLDILVFFEVGMAPIMTLLSNLRLAPIQCVAWGHPITTGSPTMDYFLSSEKMEPDNGDSHYTEKLIRLPNIGISYLFPNFHSDAYQEFLPSQIFKLLDSSIIYLSCQSLFKYLPQYDYIFARIAQKVSNAKIVFLESSNSNYVTQQFKRRLKRAFAMLELDSEDYCVFLRRLKHFEYISVNLVSDVFLDTLAWSGGNTTLEAIACGLPIVTCPGEFMRGRHAYGILKTLGVEETIANSEEEYINLAVKLGKDPQWRQQLRDKIKANYGCLYDDQQVVIALERFYEQAIADWMVANSN